MPRKSKSKADKKQKKAKRGKAQTGAAQQKRAPYAPSTSVRNSIMPKNNIRKNTSVHEAVCAVTDPFCYKARLAKWPDGQGAGTLAMQLRGRLPFLVNSGAAGNFYQLTGDLPYSLLGTASYAAPNYTLAANYSPIAVTDFSLFASQYRIVTWGVIIRNVAPATTASGTIVVRKMSKQYAAGAVFASGLMYGSEVHEFPVYPGMEVCIISKPAGNTARNFVALNTNSTIVNGASWDTITVELLNTTVANGGVALDIEYVYNVEIQLSTTYSSMHEFIPPSTPNVPAITSAASSVINKATTVVEGGIKAAGEHVLSRVEDFFMSAGTDLLGLLF